MATITRNSKPAKARKGGRQAAPEALPLDVRAMNAAASGLVVLAAIGVVLAALWWATRAPQFSLRGIRIEGDVAHANAATLRANAAAKLQGNFFSLDLRAAQAAFQSVPWVRRAVVQRVWPDRLSVRLEEHRAAAWWQVDAGEDKLVNVQGEVFEANPGDVEDEGLPVLRGPEGSSAALLAMHGRLVPVFAEIDARIETLAMSARGSWRVELDSGAQVELGRGSDDEVVARTRAFTGTVGQLTVRYQRPLAHADLRHADGYALKLRGIGTLEPGVHQLRKK